ncbi:uncharacterized protein [Periplaneta americana]|uniref:uncharacterized protein n=1 Tax=Periplaneta americana TaxID=6978 RepID=UPI0037E87B13
MHSFVVFLLALGLVSASSDANIRKLMVYGAPALGMDSLSIDALLPHLGLGLGLGLRAPSLYSPPPSLNHPNPLSALSLAPHMHPAPLNLRDIYNTPVIVVAKARADSDALSAYVVEHGLSSLAENPHTQELHELLRAGSEKSAMVIPPSALRNIQAINILNDLPVEKVAIPAGIRGSKLIRIINSHVPLVLIHEKEDATNIGAENLIRIGSLEVSESRISAPLSE